MNTIRVSATAARNDFFKLLDKVASGVKVTIVKDAKEVAELVSKKPKTDWKGLHKAMKASHGILKDFDYKNPARQAASKVLGKWDKGLKYLKKI